jgi:predicted secreted protein
MPQVQAIEVTDGRDTTGQWRGEIMQTANEFHVVDSMNQIGFSDAQQQEQGYIT